MQLFAVKNSYLNILRVFSENICSIADLTAWRYKNIFFSSDSLVNYFNQFFGGA